MKPNLKTIFAVLVLASACASAPATDDPGSPSAVLQDLHRRAALGAAWAAFGPESYAKGKIHVVTEVPQPWEAKGESTTISIEELGYILDGQAHTTVWDADHKESEPGMPCPLDAPDFAADKAERLPDDTVLVGKKAYPAQVYRFEKRVPVLNETDVIVWTFWLSPEAPGGELRRVTESSSEDPSYGGVEDVRLVATKVVLLVGKKKLACYCRDGVDRERDGTVTETHTCYNDSVPGGVVLQTSRKSSGGTETQRSDYILIDYKAEPPDS